jgi:hypothetical protein
LARFTPPSKIGRLICGETPRAAAGLEQAGQAVAAEPAVAVSEMRGKKAARAAPMLALAARRRSGLLHVGTALQQVRRQAGRNLGQRQDGAGPACGSSSAGTGCPPADQRVLVQRAWLCGDGHVAARRFHAGLGIVHIR